MNEPAQPTGRTIRILLAAAAVWLIVAIFPFARDVTLIKFVGYQLFVLAAAVAAWWVHRGGEPLRVHVPLTIPVLVLALALLVAVPFATNPGHAMMEWVRLAAGVAAFFLAMQAFQGPQRLKPLLGAIVVALSLSSLYGLLQWAGWDPFPWEAVTAQDLDLLRRAPATYGNPNLAAHAVILGIPLTLLLASLGQRWAVASLPLLLGHLMLNGTRGAAAGLAMAAVLVVTAWAVSRVRVRSASAPPAVTVFMGFAVPALIAITAGLAVSGAWFQRSGTPVPQDLTLNLRFHSTYGAAEMIRDRPLLGHGPGHFEIDNPPYWTPLERQRYAEIGRRNARVHNEPLELAVQGGIPAGAAYLAILLIAIAAAMHMAASAADPTRRRTGLAFAAVFMAFMVDGLFGFNLHAPVSGGLFWLLLGALAGLLAMPWSGSRLLGVPRAAAAPAAVTALALVMTGFSFASSMFALRGDGALHYGESEAAHEQYRIAARLHPWDWLIQRSLGGLMLDQTYYGNSIRHYEEALALNPNDLVSLGGLGRAYARYAAHLESEGMNGFEEAERDGLQAAEEALELVPGLVPAAFARAVITANQAARLRGSPGDSAAAQTAREAAMQLLAVSRNDPGRAWRLIANARGIAGDFEGTAEAFALALTHDPDNEPTWRAFDNFAHAAAMYPAYLDSIRWREERLRLEEPDDTARRADMAMRRAEAIAAGYDSPAHVRAAFADAARFEPLQPGLWPYFYALVTQDEHQRPAFVAAVREAGQQLESVMASEALPVRIAGLAAQGSQALPAAVENGYQAIAFERDQERPLEDLQNAYGWVWAFLLDEAGRAALDDETAGLVYLRLGMTAILLGNDAQALAVLEVAEPNLPREPKAECLRQMADAARRLGRVERAVEALSAAVELTPENLGIRLDHARALAAAGNHDGARRAYQLILGSFEFDAENRARLEAEMEQLGTDAAP